MNSLQQIVEGKSSRHRHGDFPIEHKAGGLEREEGGGQFRKITRQWLAGLGLKFDAGSVAKGQTAEAVPFRLVLPAVAVRDFVHQQRVHWRKRPLERQAHKTLSN